jgi:hypothetical protein
MAKTLPVSEEGPLADSEERSSFIRSHVTFRHQENGEGSLYLFHGVGAVPKLIGLNDLVFGKGCDSRHGTPP